MQSRKHRPDRLLVSAIMLFYFSAFLLVAFRGEIRWQGFALAVAVPALIYLSSMWIPRFLPTDKLMLSLANFLCALGILILFITDKDAGTERGIHQALAYGVGLVVMFCCILLVRYLKNWDLFIRILLIGSAALIALPLLIGQEQNGAKNWIHIGISMQPSELVKIPFLIILAYEMSRHRLWIWLGLSLYCLLILMLQKDLGTALIYYGASLFLYYVSSGNLLWTGVGVLGGCGAAVLGYMMFAHVKKRVAIWKNPWMYYEGSGYQIVQALIAIASGGLFGMGLGLGSPRVIPVYYTDCIFAVICEQFGIIFGILVLVIYIIMVLRGCFIALQARDSFYGLLCMGVVAVLGFQTFLIIGGVLKLIPLTGVTMPFVSYGGSSLVSCMGLIGLIQGVATRKRDEMTDEYIRYYARPDDHNPLR